MTRELLVLNQTETPAFQRLIEDASSPASVTFLCGNPSPATRSGVTVRKSVAYNRDSMGARAVTWAAYAAHAAVHASLRRSDFILAVTNPPVLPHLSWLARMSKPRQYGLLIWDIYPDHLCRLGVLDSDAFVATGWRHLNQLALENAAFVVTISQGMADALRGHYSSPDRATNLSVIPNWSDTEQLKPVPRDSNVWTARLSVTPDQLIVMYSGNLGATHGLDGLLEAAQLLRSIPAVRFVVAGRGHGRANLEQVVESKRLENVHVMDPVGWDEFPHLLALADVAVVSQAAGSENLSIPSKTMSALASGCAVLALTDQTSDLGRLVLANQVGSVVAPDDASGICEALLDLSSNRDRLDSLKLAARQLALSDFSFTRITAAWRNVLQPQLV